MDSHPHSHSSCLLSQVSDGQNLKTDYLWLPAVFFGYNLCLWQRTNETARGICIPVVQRAYHSAQNVVSKGGGLQIWTGDLGDAGIRYPNLSSHACNMSILLQHTCPFSVIQTGFPGGTSGREPACQCKRYKRRRFNICQEDPLEEGMATHSSILVWRIPMDRGAWQAIVRRLAKSWTQLKQFSMHTHTHTHTHTYT